MTEQQKQEIIINKKTTVEVIPQKKSLAETMSMFMGGEEATPVDVAMELLNPKNAIMHTDIKSVPLMNKLKLMQRMAEDPEEAEFWQELYDVNVLHPVSEKRKREATIAGMFASLQNWYSMQINGGMMEQGKKGLFGKR